MITVLRCPPLPSANATIANQQKDRRNNINKIIYDISSVRYPYRSSVKYNCGRGHTIKGRSEISCDVITVTENGTSANWSDAPPVCVGENNSIYRPNVVTN